MPDPAYVRRADVLATRLPGDELALLHPETQHYYTLNEVGGWVWDALAQPATVSGLAAGLVDAYEVSEAEARADVQRILDGLRAEALVTAQPGPGGA